MNPEVDKEVADSDPCDVGVGETRRQRWKGALRRHSVALASVAAFTSVRSANYLNSHNYLRVSFLNVIAFLH